MKILNSPAVLTSTGGPLRENQPPENNVSKVSNELNIHIKEKTHLAVNCRFLKLFL